MYKTVIFDLDGTLLDTLSDLAQAGNYALSTLGLPLHPIESYKTMVGNGIPKLISRMLPKSHQGISTQELALSLFERYYKEHMTDLTAPYPGIEGLLNQLKQNNIILAVATNKSHFYANNIVNTYFPNMFHAVQGLQEEFPAKPDPTIVDLLIDLLGANRTNTLYCGDSNVDMHTAYNSNLDSCGVLWGFRSESELKDAGAKYLVHNPTEISDIVAGSFNI